MTEPNVYFFESLWVCLAENQFLEPTPLDTIVKSKERMSKNRYNLLEYILLKRERKTATARNVYLPTPYPLAQKRYTQRLD